MPSEASSRTDAEYRPGVGIMLLNDHDEVLVGRRNDVPDEEWQMPQGGIDEGEDPRATAFRELKEEIGTDQAEIVAESRSWLRYDLPEDLIGKAWGGRWRGQRQKWFVMRFTGTDADITVDTEHPEFAAWKWVPVEQLPSLIVSFKRQVYVNLLAEFPELARGLGRGLSEMLADPIVRMTMAADCIDEHELYDMLLAVAEHLRKNRHLTAIFSAIHKCDDPER
jgi:putative (di)nucleoside polyphosphate hydrolase